MGVYDSSVTGGTSFHAIRCKPSMTAREVHV